jgi:hypothetical protein
MGSVEGVQAFFSLFMLSLTLVLNSKVVSAWKKDNFKF